MAPSIPSVSFKFIAILFILNAGSKPARANQLQPSCGDLQDLLRQAQECEQENTGSSPEATPIERFENSFEPSKLKMLTIGT